MKVKHFKIAFIPFSLSWAPSAWTTWLPGPKWVKTFPISIRYEWLWVRSMWTFKPLKLVSANSSMPLEENALAHIQKFGINGYYSACFLSILSFIVTSKHFLAVQRKNCFFNLLRGSFFPTSGDIYICVYIPRNKIIFIINKSLLTNVISNP